MKIQTRRIYDEASNEDGTRILIDRIWPRGVSREAAGIDYWAKALAPSDQLRKWYRHETEKWETFRSRYHEELDANLEELDKLRQHLTGGTITIVFASRETRYNNATAFRDYLETYLKRA